MNRILLLPSIQRFCHQSGRRRNRGGIGTRGWRSTNGM